MLRKNWFDSQSVEGLGYYIHRYDDIKLLRMTIYIFFVSWYMEVYGAACVCMYVCMCV